MIASKEIESRGEIGCKWALFDLGMATSGELGSWGAWSTTIPGERRLVPPVNGVSVSFGIGMEATRTFYADHSDAGNSGGWRTRAPVNG